MTENKLTWTEQWIDAVGIGWWEQAEIEGTSACAYVRQKETMKWMPPKKGENEECEMHLTDIDTGATWGKVKCTTYTLDATAAEMRRKHALGELPQNTPPHFIDKTGDRG